MNPGGQQPNALESASILLKKSFSLYFSKLPIFLSLGAIAFAVGMIQLFTIRTHSLLFFGLSVVAAVVVSYVVYLAMLQVATFPAGMTITESLSKVEHVIIPSAWVSVVMILLLLGSTFVLIIPGIIILNYIIFSLFAVVVDKHEKNDAILYSWSLVNGRWWQVFGRMVLANIVFGIIWWGIMGIFWLMGLGETPFQTIARAHLGDHSVSIFQSVLEQGIANFFSLPIIISFLAIFYKSLKRTAPVALNAVETERIKKIIHSFVIIGLVFFVTGIFFSTLRLAEILPQMIKVTHAPAAVFSAF